MTRPKAVRVWLAGLLHAVIAGAANAAAGALADPGHFNLTHEGIAALGKLAAAGAVIGVVMYLKQSPLPVPGTAPAARGGEAT